MGVNFSAIKRGERFYIDGEPFVKTSELTFDDAAGFERYIDPLQDARISKGTAPAATEPTTDTQEWITDPATRIQSKNPNFGKKLKKQAVRSATKKLEPKPPKATKKAKA
jgi:hypothetical protein